nr:hypothetical protein [Ferrimicrobium acidiphilum]
MTITTGQKRAQNGTSGVVILFKVAWLGYLTVRWHGSDEVVTVPIQRLGIPSRSQCRVRSGRAPMTTAMLLMLICEAARQSSSEEDPLLGQEPKL